jgi:hypothetical protein
MQVREGGERDQGIQEKTHFDLMLRIATKDPSAKANAWQSFEALELLNNVSGITGIKKYI